MKKSAISLVLFFSVHLLSLNLQAQVTAEVSNKTFPFPRAEMATISSVVFASPAPANLVRIQTSNYNVQDLMTLKGQGHVKSVFWPGRSDQPLVFMVPGIGGYSDRGNISDLAKIFQSWGYNVVTFNNPMSWQFALTLIPDGAPGYFPEDASVLYDNMLSVKNQLVKKYGLKYSRALIVAYSMGCQYAPELLKIDDQKKQINFTEAILMSPPLDIRYALHKYDQINNVGSQVSAGSSLTNYAKIRGRLIGLLEKLISLPPAQAVAYYGTAYPLNDKEGEVIIGGSFKESIEDILFVTSLIHPDRKTYFKSPLSESRRQPRYDEIKKISFDDYFQKFILQKINVRSQYIDSQDLLASFSLRKKINQLTADPRIKFVLVQDDPISTPEDIAFFSEAFADRALVLNHGGHAGFYWFPGFAADLKSFLKP